MLNDSKIYEVATIECDRLCAAVCETRTELLDTAKQLGANLAEGTMDVDSAYGVLRVVMSKASGMYLVLYKTGIIDHDEYYQLNDECGYKFINAFRQGFDESKEKLKNGGDYEKCKSSIVC